MKILRKHIYFALIISSCAAPPTNSSVSKDSANLTAPEEVGLISDSLNLIEEHIQWAIDSQYVAGGLALVAKDNKIVYHEVVGFSNREKTTKLAKDHIFRMASMTKPITTVAVMQLYEQGKLNLSDPVSEFIPEFADSEVVDQFSAKDTSYTSHKAENELTIHHLLTHTSGLSYGDPPLGPLYSSMDIVLGWTKDSVLLEDNIPKMGKLPLHHEPGARFTYGVSIDVLGRIVEIISGLSLDKYFQKYIFSPLGMVDTYFYLPKEKHDRLVNVWFTSDVDPKDYSIAEYLIDGYSTYFSGGAGLVSTSTDYFQFASAILNKGLWNESRILREETVKMMMSNQIDTLFSGEGERFGYGGSVHTTDGPFGRKVGRFSWGGYW